MSLSNAKLALLKIELDTDPLARGYAGMTDEEAADDLNTVYRQIVGTELNPEDLRNQVVWTEYELLSDRYAQDMQWLASNGRIDVSPGSFGRAAIVGMFGGGSVTVSNLLTVLTEDVSRAFERFGESVTELDVFKARSLP